MSRKKIATILILHLIGPVSSEYKDALNGEEGMAGVSLLPPEKVTVDMGVQAFASKIKPLFAEKDTETEKENPKHPLVLETEDVGC